MCVQKSIQTFDVVHVELTNMGKFYVGNVNESRDVASCELRNNKIKQFHGGVVLKDVAPCGGVCP